MDQEIDLREALKERFFELPKVVQDAITSTDIQKLLQGLAETSKLHVDQWQILENEVIMALYGVTEVTDLQTNIQKHVNVPAEMAALLATNISKMVFEPIRGEIESSLRHPDAQAAVASGVDTVRSQILANNAQPSPATPPPPSPTQKVARAPISAAYHAGEPSSVRASVDDDPYRESPT